MAHWHAWSTLQTQWRYTSAGMGAPVATGLDYAATSRWLQDAMGYKPHRRGTRSLEAALHAMRACEAGALQGMEAARKRKPGH